jgi:multiple antibiotic resistance protein
MQINFTEILSAFLVLFAVIDIIGSLPMILSIKKSAGEIHAEKATLVSMFLMIGFLFLGERIIHLFGIDVYSFAVAGALVLFVLAIEMILGVQLFKQDPKTLKTASIVPIAFPIIAGAGTMTSLIALRAEYQVINIVIAVVLNVPVIYFVLKSSSRIERLLGDGGIAVLQKVFGVILLAIAVKLFSSNVQHLLTQS